MFKTSCSDFVNCLFACLELSGGLYKTPMMKLLQFLKAIASQISSKSFFSRSSLLVYSYRNSKKTYSKKTIKDLKHKFLKSTLSSHKPKLVWKTIYRILRPSHTVILASPNDLNNYYANLAETLTGAETTFVTKSYLPDNDTSHHYIVPTNYNVVYKELINLRNDCTTGFDSIPSKFIKPLAEYLASLLTHIINNCIKKRTFPKAWKIAKICPVPKIQTPKSCSDYRPISILPILSKIFEKVILNQLKLSFQNHDVLQDTQDTVRAILV